MIGGNLFIDIISSHQESIKNLLADCKKNDSGVLLDTPAIKLSFEKPYPSYPYGFFAVAGFEIVLEGLVYNKNKNEHETAFNKYLAGTVPDFNGLREAMATWSGEWLCWFFKNDDIFIINDRLGRLDTHLCFTDKNLFVGRSLNWLSKHMQLEFDQISVATYLWCCSPIGLRSLYKNVERMAGNSFIGVNITTGKATYTPGQPLNFEIRQEQSVTEAANNLSDLLLQASKRIADTWKGQINISLSAGQDSRAVASAFARVAKDRVIATSYLNKSSEKDVRGATEIAKILGIPYKAYPVANREGYEQELLEKKMGQNYLGMSFILDFNKQLLQDNPNGFLYVTGDGGDRAIPYIGETSNNMGADEFIQKILHRNSAMSLSQIEKLTGVKKADFLHYLHGLLASYPEQNNNDKSIHFNFYERAINQFMSGEDRSRFYFWTATPFYDLDFFIAAMKVPDAVKKGIKMFREFQNILNKEVANVPDGKIGYSINSLPFKVKKLGYEWFRSSPQWVRAPLRKLGGIHVALNTESDADRNSLVEKLNNFKLLSSILRSDEVRSFLPGADLEQYAYLKTLIALNNVIEK